MLNVEFGKIGLSRWYWEWEWEIPFATLTSWAEGLESMTLTKNAWIMESIKMMDPPRFQISNISPRFRYNPRHPIARGGRPDATNDRPRSDSRNATMHSIKDSRWRRIGQSS